MNQQRQAEYENSRDVIVSWAQEYRKALQEASSAGGTPPSPMAPPSTNDAYKRVLRMIEEDGVLTTAFDSLPPGDLSIASALAVIEAIDELLRATRQI